MNASLHHALLRLIGALALAAFTLLAIGFSHWVGGLGIDYAFAHRGPDGTVLIRHISDYVVQPQLFVVSSILALIAPIYASFAYAYLLLTLETRRKVFLFTGAPLAAASVLSGAFFLIGVFLNGGLP